MEEIGNEKSSINMNGFEQIGLLEREEFLSSFLLFRHIRSILHDIGLIRQNTFCMFVITIQAFLNVQLLLYIHVNYVIDLFHYFIFD